MRPLAARGLRHRVALAASYAAAAAPYVVSYGEGLKRLHHPELGLLELEFSAFAVDGRPDLGTIVYNPATSDAAQRMRACIGAEIV